jgi:hypothetical protein
MRFIMSNAESDPKQNKTTQNKTTVAQSVVIGVVGGATEVLIDHPFWSMKKIVQCGEVFTFNPRILYRGLVPNLASMVPITAIQVGLDRFVQKYLMNNPKELSNSQKIVSGFVGGVGSGFVGCPAELLMTHQSSSNKSFAETAKLLYGSDGIKGLYKSLRPTMVRDGVFSAAALGVGPILKEKFKQNGMKDESATLAAGVTAGVGATVLTHPVDTVKTVQQSVDPHRADGFFQTGYKIYKAGGLRKLMAGVMLRSLRASSAVIIIGEVKNRMEAQYAEKNRSKIKKSGL